MKAHVSRITYCVLFIVLLVQAASAAPTEPLGPPAVPEPRSGLASTLSSKVLCDGRSWQWWWSASMAKKDPACTVSPEHVPMLAWSSSNYNLELAAHAATKMQPDTWLVFNECDNNYQCATKPEEAAAFYHDTLLPFALSLDPNARLIVGGANGGRCGVQWLADFVTYYRATYRQEVPRAGWHFHPYADLWEGPTCDHTTEWNWPVLHDVNLLWNEWLLQMHHIKGFVMAYGRPGVDEVWFTEMGCLAPAPSVCRTETVTLASRQLAWFDGPGRWVDRFAWFSDGGKPGGRWDWTMMYYKFGDGEAATFSRQPLGDLWLSHQPLPAVPLTVRRRYFPIIGYAADVVPQPTPPPGGYP
jgi:hypothetical protein